MVLYGLFIDLLSQYTNCIANIIARINVLATYLTKNDIARRNKRTFENF